MTSAPSLPLSSIRDRLPLHSEPYNSTFADHLKIYIYSTLSSRSHHERAREAAMEGFDMNYDLILKR